MTPSECSGCEALDVEALYLLEGEAFYFQPYALEGGALEDRFTWSRRTGANETQSIGSDEDEEVHHHGGALFFLKPLRKDSGLYTARQRSSSGLCFDHRALVFVGPAAGGRSLFPAVRSSDVNQRVPCPDPVQHTCGVMNGSFAWLKGARLLEDQHRDHLWISNAAREDQGVYTCVCTWTHNDTQYTTSASRRLEVEAVSAHQDVMILAPADKEKFAEEGSALQLNCSVFCGTNVRSRCEASWRVDGAAPHRLAGYKETTETVNLRPSNTTVSTAVLSILTVSARHFTASFLCRGRGLFRWESVSLRLKRRGTMTPLFAGGVCVSLLCVIATLLVKCFAIDLALLFRACCPFSRRDKVVVSARVSSTILHPRLLPPPPPQAPPIGVAAMRLRHHHQCLDSMGGFCLRRYQHLYPWFILLQDGVQSQKMTLHYCNILL
ncbi:interleukin-1 receptor type 2-like isoform X2 [Pseudoliparis swirei]|uniref:interleukin-1 receptor type 2-like isoform X2 n=1 Tax=Pseudoliparis swirei TaxID=2059687 RepID=UPI0024BEEFB2|nr:interleukin-1 receptor type 2-like isoform X2 [Pseudoliparis swirei]